MNEKNLKPNSERSPKERQEFGRKGGIASGEARRRKRDRREWAKIIGSLPVEVVKPDGKALPAADLDAAMIIGLYRKAAAGNERAARLLLELHGDLEQTVNVNGPAPIICSSQEEMDATLKALAERGARAEHKVQED